MSEVIINFENEKREGFVAVRTYLIDAAKRLGIYIDCDCLDEEIETKGSCKVKVTKGVDLLSTPTKLEMELLSSDARKNGERLACQTKIEKSGEVTIMTDKKDEKKEETSEQKDKQEEYKKEFEELPLEKKISNLLELEAIALSETFSFVMNSPYAAVGKVMDVLAGFGHKMEQKDKEAKRPDEHIEKEEVAEESKDEKSKVKEKTSATAKKKTASKSTTAKKKTVKKKTEKAEDKNTTADKKEENGA